jgi:hypothetical protein
VLLRKCLDAASTSTIHSCRVSRASSFSGHIKGKPIKMHLRQSLRFGEGLGHARDATTDLIGRDLELDAKGAKPRLFSEKKVVNGKLGELRKS